MKIDVEGAEPAILGALLPLLRKHAPDLLIEVLDITEYALASLAWPAGYEFYEIGDQGPVQRDSLRATGNRDYFITARAREHGLGSFSASLGQPEERAAAPRT